MILWFYNHSAQISCFSFWSVHVSCRSGFDNHTAQGHFQMSFRTPKALYILFYSFFVVLQSSSLKESRKPKISPLSAGTTISRTQVKLFDKFSFLLLLFCLLSFRQIILLDQQNFIKIHYWLKATVKSICCWFTIKLKKTKN